MNSRVRLVETELPVTSVHYPLSVNADPTFPKITVDASTAHSLALKFSLNKKGSNLTEHRLSIKSEIIHSTLQPTAREET